METSYIMTGGKEILEIDNEEFCLWDYSAKVKPHGGATEIILLSKEVSLYSWTPSVVLRLEESERSLPSFVTTSPASFADEWNYLSFAGGISVMN